MFLASNPRTQEAEARGLQVQSQPEVLHSEKRSQKVDIEKEGKWEETKKEKRRKRGKSKEGGSEGQQGLKHVSGNVLCTPAG